MNIVYRTTQQGHRTRTQLLNHIPLGEELTRDDLVLRSGLTYEQVRRQTKNLCIDGILRSRLEGGQRYYQRA